jgi:hypothetical protein
LASGCGAALEESNKPPENLLFGVVRLDDDVLNYGGIEFFDSTGKSRKARINTDGTFRTPNIFDGEINAVIIMGSPPRMTNSGGPSGKTLKLKEYHLAAQYTDKDKTTLKYTVKKEGLNEVNIDMKSEAKTAGSAEPKKESKDSHDSKKTVDSKDGQRSKDGKDSSK